MTASDHGVGGSRQGASMTASLMRPPAFGHRKHVVPTSVRGRFSPFTKHRRRGFERFKPWRPVHCSFECGAQFLAPTGLALAKIGSYEQKRWEAKGGTRGAAGIGSLYAEGRGFERFKPCTPVHGSFSSDAQFSPSRPAPAKLWTGEWVQGGDKNVVRGAATGDVLYAGRRGFERFKPWAAVHRWFLDDIRSLAPAEAAPAKIGSYERLQFDGKNATQSATSRGMWYADGRGFERFKPWTAVGGSCSSKTQILARTEPAPAKILSNEGLRFEHEMAGRGAVSSGLLYSGGRGFERFKPWGWTSTYLVDAVTCRPSAAHSGTRCSTPELGSTHQPDLLAASLDQQTGQGF